MVLFLSVVKHLALAVKNVLDPQMPSHARGRGLATSEHLV